MSQFAWIVIISRWMIATEKVSFKIASGASYVNILFWKPEACGQTVLPDRLIWMGQKSWKILKFKCHIFSNFQSMWKSEFFTNSQFFKVFGDFQTLCLLKQNLQEKIVVAPLDHERFLKIRDTIHCQTVEKKATCSQRKK